MQMLKNVKMKKFNEKNLQTQKNVFNFATQTKEILTTNN